MSGVQFTRAAQAELIGQVAYYDERNAGLGIRFSAAVEKACERALAFPFSGAHTRSGARFLRVKGFPFLLVYIVEDSAILIIAIAHNARASDYWAARLPNPD